MMSAKVLGLPRVLRRAPLLAAAVVAAGCGSTEHRTSHVVPTTQVVELVPAGPAANRAVEELKATSHKAAGRAEREESGYMMSAPRGLATPSGATPAR
jgi:hypothetical protein